MYIRVYKTVYNIAAAHRREVCISFFRVYIRVYKLGRMVGYPWRREALMIERKP